MRGRAPEDRSVGVGDGCRVLLAIVLFTSLFTFAIAPAAASVTDRSHVGEVHLQVDVPGGDGEDEGGGSEIPVDVTDGEGEVDVGEGAGPDIPIIGTNDGAGGSTGDAESSEGGFVGNRLEDIREWFAARTVDEAIEVRDEQLEEMNHLLYTLPAPGEPTDVWSWYTPENGWWPDALDFYWLLAGPAIGALFLVGGASFIVDDPTLSKGYLRLSLVGVFGVLFGPLIIGMTLHTCNALVMALAPSGPEFFESPENIAQLATGSALIFILLKVKVGLLIIGVFVIFSQFILTFFLAGTLGLSFAMRGVPMGVVNSSGALLFNAFFVLPLLKLAQALLMRFAFELDWGAYAFIGGPLALMATIIFLLIALVLLPWKVLKKVFAAAGVHLGMSAIHDKAEKAKDVTIEAARNPRETWDNSVRSVKSGIRNNTAVAAATTVRNRVSPNATAAAGGSNTTSSTSSGSGSRSNTSASTSSNTTSSSGTGSTQGPIPFPSERTRDVRRRRREIRRGGSNRGDAARGDD